MAQRIMSKRALELLRLAGSVNRSTTAPDTARPSFSQENFPAGERLIQSDDNDLAVGLEAATLMRNKVPSNSKDDVSYREELNVPIEAACVKVKEWTAKHFCLTKHSKTLPLSKDGIRKRLDFSDLSANAADNIEHASLDQAGYGEDMFLIGDLEEQLHVADNVRIEVVNASTFQSNLDTPILIETVQGVPSEESFQSPNRCQGSPTAPARLVTPENNSFVTSQGSQKRTIQPKDKATRKKSYNPKVWKAVKAKAALEKGIEHLNVKGKVIRGRSLGGGCRKSCRLKCHEKIKEQNRREIFTAFWKIEIHSRKWDFINKHTTVSSPKERRPGDSETCDRQRKFTRSFFFFVGDKAVKVCRTMFLSTLDITEQWCKTAAVKLDGKHTISPDKRGKHNKHKQIPADVKESVRDHISKFPRVTSHYCRARSGREYFEPGLCISELYRLYVAWMSTEQPSRQKASERVYREIFNTEFNISFHKTKKDLCDLCFTYETKCSKLQKIKRKPVYDLHIQRKKEARAARELDKIATKADPNICFASFDLQKVLSTPKDNAGTMYYNRKLSVFNFTVWENTRHEGFCYVWHEGEAQRGANEVASSLFLFIEHMVDNCNVTQFRFWSDNCSGQNKNKYLFSMYTYATAKYGVEIIHRYLEKGHTENAGDSMHSNIERHAKEFKLYTPEEWYKLIKDSKKTSAPYNVIKLSEHVLDFHALAENFQSWKNHAQVQWKNLREIKTSTGDPQIVSIKHDLQEPPVQISVAKKVRGRPICLKTFQFANAFDGPRRLQAAKLKDLWNLCKNLTIPSIHHSLYRALLDFPCLALDSVDELPISDSAHQENAMEELLDEMRADDLETHEWTADCQDNEKTDDTNL